MTEAIATAKQDAVAAKQAVITTKLLLVGAAISAILLLVGVPVLATMMVVIGGNAQAMCANHTISQSQGDEQKRVPLDGSWQTTSDWGTRTHPIRGDTSHHYGLDFGGDKTVVAASPGAVDATPTTGGEGNQVALDHGDGVQTKYKHLASRTVKEGDTVSSGEQIGVMGNTGNWTTGAHLHFEVWKNGSDIDPRTWLALGDKKSGTGAEKTSGDGTQTRSQAQPDSGGTREHRARNDVDVDAHPVDRSQPSQASAPAPANTPDQVAGYSGDQLANAATIMQVGQDMGLDAPTVTLGVMTAMGESSLVNVEHGDAAGPDSRGVFQQRAGWGPEDKRMDVAAAARMFFDELVSIDGYHDLEPTIAAHRTQRNADPYHYEQFWVPAKKIVAAIGDNHDLAAELGDGSGFAGCEAIAEGPSDSADDGRSADGSGKAGFDCSGLVLYAVHQATGKTLPRTTVPQMHDDQGTKVDRDWEAIQPGDVIGFSQTNSADDIDHDGIYIGGGKMVHAPRPGKTVEITRIKNNDYWETQTWRIKRFTD